MKIKCENCGFRKEPYRKHGTAFIRTCRNCALRVIALTGSDPPKLLTVVDLI